MLKRPDRIQAKATRVGLRLLQSTLLFLNSRSTSMVRSYPLNDPHPALTCLRSSAEAALSHGAKALDPTPY